MTDTAEATTPPHQASWHHILPYAASALVLLAIVVPFLRFNEYDLLLPESLILIGGAGFIGVAIGGISRIRPQTLGPLLIALTLSGYLFFRREVIEAVGLTANAVAGITGHPVAVLVILCVALFLTTALVCVLMRRHLETIVVAVFGTMVLTTIALPTETGGESVQTGALPKDLKSLPPVIQIILDEHIGLAGLPSDIEESKTARDVILATYKDFALYSSAYSRFAETKYSITSLVNRDIGLDVESYFKGDAFRSSLKENDWFGVLKAKGYAIKTYQSAWLDFCTGPYPPDACYTYSFYSPNAIQRGSLSTERRLRALIRKLLVGRGALQLEPMVSMEALDQFRIDISEAPRGVAYVLHLLSPHHGYIYAGDCSVVDPSAWLRSGYGEDRAYSAAERNELYGRYLNQLVCANRQIAELFAELKQLGVYDEATIIVHGDHGSRLGARYFINAPDVLTNVDRIDHYSTLLAIKAPGVAPGVREEPVALQRIFAETFLGGARKTSPRAGEIFVRADNDDFAPAEFPWPDPPTSMARQSALADGRKAVPE